MSIAELVGKAQTVLGIIDPDQLGITLPHEHFLFDMSVMFEEPAESSQKELAHQPVSFSNIGWIHYHPWDNVDNIVLMDEEVAISEGLRFKRAGGNSVIDVTNIGLGRDPLALTRISRATGLNIIMGAGYYVDEARPKGMNFTEEALTEENVRDITVGVGNTGIRAGILGEIGNSWPLLDRDKIILRAVSSAQKQTGVPVLIHPGRSPSSPFEIIEVLDKAGADINRVVMSHMETRIFDHNTRISLAKTGCYFNYDTFSWEGWFPRRMVLSESNPIKTDLPNDAERINQIMALIDEGFLNQILISHDHCMKHRLWHYGGSGYSHILDNVVPLMREKGMPEEHIHALLVENPRRLLQFV